MQRICDRLGSGAVKIFMWRWLRRLPSPFTDADRRAGSNYELAFRQFEMSQTQVFDRPASDRSFFEGLIRDHLDVGRPDQIALIFDRRVTPKTLGEFRTKVITRGVDPQLCCYYKSSRMKQYFKEHRALRTETVISDTKDFGIGRGVNAENWNALRAVGQAANRRLCDAEASDASPAPDVVTFEEVTLPSDDADGLHAPGLRFGDRRVMALFSVIVGFATYPPGSTTGNSPNSSGPSSTRPTAPGRPPTTCDDYDERESSNASHTRTATSSPATAGASRCYSPRPTAASLRRGSAGSTWTYPTTSQPAHRWPKPGATSTRPSTSSSTTPCSPPRT